jgi:hypothetical protein
MKRKQAGWFLSILPVLLFLSGCATAKSPNPAALEPGSALVVTAERANLRACSSLRCRVVAVLARGDGVLRIGGKKGWVRVRVKATGRKGWVAARLVGKDTEKKQPEITEEWSKPDK